MAVLAQVMIAKRQSNTNYDFDDDNNCDIYGHCYSTWGSWGRWVVLVLIIFGFVLLAFALSCFNSRRRRRQGLQPMYGTGWMAKPPPYATHQDSHQYQPANQGPNPYYHNYAPPPPLYTQNKSGQDPINAQQTGTTFRSEDGYYGHHYGQHGNGESAGMGQGQGIELQQPASAYTREGQPGAGGENVYQPPLGPPPGKN